MNFKVEVSDHAGSFIVRLEDGTCAVVNLDYPDWLERGSDPADLMNRGFWPYDDVEPLSDETLEAIGKVLKDNL
ncbi:MAG: hypothetical protein J6I68_12680 [Butyrivibrio sp.]|uniref:hypothetical protein n=1 Tax=Butyrivibrio sp. TaxID=28121 RepID=UPI001B4503F9|nr:hypothetical protein [Butyrivibrio sp.]MBP3784093.1 hypothetical protein [Butyrivibrio sp.]MBP3824322.1 hypothetical protein [Butyrivibrio sp.]